jgi:hypothetical protein
MTFAAPANPHGMSAREGHMRALRKVNTLSIA